VFLRSLDPSHTVIALSMGYHRGPPVGMGGLGFDQLKALMLRIARPIVSSGLCLAYAGSWKEGDDNITLPLLDLIEEQRAALVDAPHRVAPLQVDPGGRPKGRRVLGGLEVM